MAMRAKQMSKSAILHRQWQSLHRQRYTLKYFKFKLMVNYDLEATTLKVKQ